MTREPIRIYTADVQVAGKGTRRAFSFDHKPGWRLLGTAWAPLGSEVIRAGKMSHLRVPTDNGGVDLFPTGVVERAKLKYHGLTWEPAIGED